MPKSREGRVLELGGNLPKAQSSFRELEDCLGHREPIRLFLNKQKHQGV